MSPLPEDASRIRINPGVMARLRSQAHNIARANGGIANIAEAMWCAALDPEISLSYSFILGIGAQPEIALSE